MDAIAGLAFIALPFIILFFLERHMKRRSDLHSRTAVIRSKLPLLITGTLFSALLLSLSLFSGDSVERPESANLNPLIILPLLFLAYGIGLDEFFKTDQHQDQQSETAKELEILGDPPPWPFPPPIWEQDEPLQDQEGREDWMAYVYLGVIILTLLAITVLMITGF